MTRHKPSTGVKRVLAEQGPVTRQWLRPSFLVTRGSYRDYNRDVELAPVYLAVLNVNAAAGTATYEILGCPASPVTIGMEALASLLRERGVKQ